MATKVSEKSTKSGFWTEYQWLIDVAKAQLKEMAVTVIEANRPANVTTTQA